MPIVRQENLQLLKGEFDERCERLRHELIGVPPNSNVWDQFAYNPEDFKRDYVQLDEQRLLIAIDDLQTCLKKLKKIRGLGAARLGNAK